EALRDIYGAPWQLRDEREVIEGALARSGNISALWGWLENPAIEVAETARLFGEAQFESIPHQTDLGGAELVELQRTTATHLSLGAEEQERVEGEMVALVDGLGSSCPIGQLAATAAGAGRG